jgi:hypothetical protein
LKWSTILGILSGNPKEEPLHYGEVFGIWTNLATNNGLIAAYRTFINHTGDEDLEKILKVNGNGLPPAPPERPVARLKDIPVGARFTTLESSLSIM